MRASKQRPPSLSQAGGTGWRTKVRWRMFTRQTEKKSAEFFPELPDGIYTSCNR
jgi:hypothetical protein